jgi:hypothetical protein
MILWRSDVYTGKVIELPHYESCERAGEWGLVWEWGLKIGPLTKPIKSAYAI